MPLGWGGETGVATQGPELVTDEERKDREGREKKGLAARNLQSASCLKPNRNWERRHGRQGWNNMFGKGGLPPCRASPGPVLAEHQPLLTCLLRSCVARGSGHCTGDG